MIKNAKALLLPSVAIAFVLSASGALGRDVTNPDRAPPPSAGEGDHQPDQVQSAGPSADLLPNSSGLSGEIVVTARRVDESLSEVPISITAITGEGLAKAGVRNIGQLQQLTPNLTVGITTGRGGSSIGAGGLSIRGQQGGNGGVTNEAAVGVYIDGVYLARSDDLFFDLPDIARIEVLRGPQGTLFGRNTTAGAISIVTNDPVNELTGAFKLRVGNFDRFDFSGVLNVPVSDTFQIRMWGAHNERGGYFASSALDKDVGDNNEDAVGLSFRWQPWQGAELVVKGDYREFKANQAGNWLTYLFPGPSLMRTVISLSSGGADTPENYIRGRDVIGSSHFETNGKNRGVVGKFETAVTDHLNARLISSYRKQNFFLHADSDGTPYQVFDSILPVNQNQQSHEFHLFGDALDDKMSWLIGAYFFKEDGTDNNILITAPIVNPRTPQYNFRHARNTSKAAFAHLSFEASEGLTLSGGIRYSVDEKWWQQTNYSGAYSSASAAQAATNPAVGFAIPVDGRFSTCLLAPSLVDAPGICRFTAEDKFKQWTYDATIDYKWIDRADSYLLTYLSHARGFRDGGRNIRATGDDLSGFGPEFVKNYEIGFKSEWFNKRLSLRGAVFHVDLTNVQVQITEIGPSGFPNQVLRNAATAKVDGGELEIEFRAPDLIVASDQLSINGGLGVSRPRYKKFVDSSGPGGTQRDRSGEAFAYAPETTLSVGLQYNVPIAVGTFDFRANWRYQSKTYLGSAASLPAEIQDGYGLLNARLGLQIDDINAEVAIFGANLFDKVHKVHAVNARGLGYILNGYGAPRTFGAEFSIRF